MSQPMTTIGWRAEIRGIDTSGLPVSRKFSGRTVMPATSCHIPDLAHALLDNPNVVKVPDYWEAVTSMTLKLQPL